MFYLGLLLPVCYVPGFVGAYIPTQWVVLSCLLPFALWRGGTFPPPALAGLATLAWSALSLLWAPNPIDSIYGLWLFAIWALSFWLGCTITDFRPLWQGLALGMAVNGAVALIQWWGYVPVETGTRISGLFFNSTLLGACATLVIIACVSQRQWLHALGCAPALALSGSRGAWAVLTLTLLTRYLRLRYVLLTAVLGAIALLLAAGRFDSNSDTDRLLIWGMALRNLTPWGNGIGSFVAYLIYDGRMVYPERAHNDYLQLLFELGLGAVPILWLYVLALTQRHSDHWPILFAVVLFSTFYFPLWAPIPAFIACVVTGAMLHDRHLAWLGRVHGRYVDLSRHDPRPPRAPHRGGEALPVPPSA